MHDWKKDLMPFFDGTLLRLLSTVAPDAPLEEIRIRAQEPLHLRFSDEERLLYAAGHRPAADENDCLELLAKLCEHSVYAREEELRGGFITLAGGYRVGFAGRAVMRSGTFDHIGEVSSVCVRIARPCKGAADSLMPHIQNIQGAPLATLLFSPPGCGKTTMLRDVARQISDGLKRCVSVVDERMELCASVRGVPQFDVGLRTDVISGCEKVQAIRMILRTLAPDVIVTDELGTKQEAEAVLDARNAGVTVFASAHGYALQALMRREAFKLLAGEKAFDRYVLLGRSRGPGTVEAVWDGEFRRETRAC